MNDSWVWDKWWNAVHSGSGSQDFETVVDFMVFNGYTAVVDEPTAMFVVELLKKFPDAKVVLTSRGTPRQWFDQHVHLDAAAVQVVPSSPAASEEGMDGGHHGLLVPSHQQGRRAVHGRLPAPQPLHPGKRAGPPAARLPGHGWLGAAVPVSERVRARNGLPSQTDSWRDPRDGAVPELPGRQLLLQALPRALSLSAGRSMLHQALLRLLQLQGK
eukprot:UN5064